MKYKDILLEIKFNQTYDYKIIDRTYAKAIEYLYDAEKYVSMCTFKVNEHYYYAVLLMRNEYLEPHFGLFRKGKLAKLASSIKLNNIEKMDELLNDEELIQKDKIANNNANFIRILGTVFQFMNDYLLKKREIGFIKIMGEPSKYKIYKKLIKSNLEKIPYKIIKEDIDDFYSNKAGEITPAKAIILKNKFA